MYIMVIFNIGLNFCFILFLDFGMCALEKMPGATDYVRMGHSAQRAVQTMWKISSIVTAITTIYV